MTYLVAYLGVLVVYLVLDQLWLRAFMRPRLARRLGDVVLERPRLGASVGFGFFYAAVLTLLAFAPGRFVAARPADFVDELGRPTAVPGVALVLLLSAVVGLMCYATRAAGNLALLRGWGWGLALVEVAWGIAASVVAALAGYYLAGAWAW